jgi:ribosomal protein S18 acetylase RimI-like enzyme
MEIRPITQLDPAIWGQVISGYTAHERYAVLRSESDATTSMTLQLEALDKPYVKVYEPPDAEQSGIYQRSLEHGFSLGAYDGERLVGVALAEPQAWNNTLWVWEFHVAESYRGQGIGYQLMETLAERCRAAGLRAIKCETQTTNVPAIRFYRKAGFSLEGIELSLYSNDDWPDGEIAVFMKRKL